MAIFTLQCRFLEGISTCILSMSIQISHRMILVRMQHFFCSNQIITQKSDTNKSHIANRVKKTKANLIQSFSGLIELPSKLEPNQYVHPIQLPTECGNDLENIDVIAIGNGITSIFGKRWDTILREIHLTTMSSEECNNRMQEYAGSFSVICAKPNNGQSISKGDSGKHSKTILKQMNQIMVDFNN